MNPERTPSPEEALSVFRKKIGAAAWQRLQSRLEEVNRDIRTHGIHLQSSMDEALAGFGAELLTGYSYGEFYDWDLYFENLYLSYYGVHRFCRTNVETFLDRQLECGFVSRTLVNPRWRQHFKPFLAQIALLGMRQSGSSAWLAGRYYERLKKSLDYWFWYQDFDKNGLCVWDSADHTGMDNQVSRAGALYSMTVEGVDLNCYLVRDLQAMAQIAQALGLEEDRQQFETQAVDLSERINRVFWDETDGFYYDRHERTGQLIRVKSVAGFVPLWLGIVPPDRAARLVEEHLHNPQEFWLPYPLATYARTEPDYYQQRVTTECNWRGTCWVPTNYMVFHGLVRQGFRELAGELAYRTFEMALAEDATREYYNAESGAGQGLYPFWGWSTLAYVMPLEFELGYDPSDPRNPAILPILSEGMGLSFR